MKTAALRSRVQRALGALLAVLSIGAGDSSKSRHAAILARVLSYELTLEERVGDSVDIAVVYRRDDPLSEASSNDWMLGLADLSSVKVKDRPISARKVPFDAHELNAAVDKGADVLLVADGLTSELPQIAKMSRARRVLTVGNSLAYIQTELTLCLAEEGDRTKIFVNMNAANLERIRFSSRLLALATLIR